MKIKKNIHADTSSNSGNKNWLVFDYTIITRFMLLRIALAKELWYQTLQKNDAKLFKVFSINIEQDRDDPSLKIYSLTILGFMIEVGLP
ncbi:hypothetical protein [Acinetobacter sp.]|uniref:hypothetical protein n=1 Tax=Acinetobacter sp. TaxID=472 RepID=UPI003890950F